MVDRPFSIREVRGSKPRFSMPEKTGLLPAVGRWQGVGTTTSGLAPLLLLSSSRERSSVQTGDQLRGAHNAENVHRPAHSSAGRRRGARYRYSRERHRSRSNVSMGVTPANVHVSTALYVLVRCMVAIALHTALPVQSMIQSASTFNQIRNRVTIQRAKRVASGGGTLGRRATS